MGIFQQPSRTKLSNLKCDYGADGCLWRCCPFALILFVDLYSEKLRKEFSNSKLSMEGIDSASGEEVDFRASLR